MVLDGYVRVSQVAGRGGESFISPSVQREQIEAWAKANGTELAEVFEELDESGARSDRPLLASALERVERGESQGIVVAKLDRFGRSLVDGLAKIDRIAAAGGVFVSVQDGLDLATPTGKLVLRIMFSMAEWELDRVRANWQTARAKAIARGVCLNAAPFGYNRGNDGRLEIDPKAGPVVAEVFRRRGEGETIKSLIDFLNSTGLSTARGAPTFVETSVRGILGNRTYRGELRSGPHFNPSAHPAIVDEVTWRLAQRPTQFRSNRRTSLLGGLLRCSSCRMKMSVEAGVFPHEGTRGGVYRCPGRTSVGACPAPARVRGEEIEGLVEHFFFQSLKPRPPTKRALRELERAGARQQKAELALARYRDDSGAVTALTPEIFAAGLAKRQEDVHKAAFAFASAKRAAETDAAVATEMEARWTGLSIAGRRAEIEQQIDCVFVAPGSEPVGERCWVCPRGTAPVDVPRRGVGLGALRPFRPAGAGGVRKLRRPARWLPSRIECELRAWRDGSVDWPTYPEFLIAGRARLYLQVLEFGGPHYWAHRLGCSQPRRVTLWTPATIRGALRPVADGRLVWPSTSVFREAGLETARQAAIRHGGIASWRNKLGLAARTGTASDRRSDEVSGS